jgi:hypothetical protein
MLPVGALIGLTSSGTPLRLLALFPNFPKVSGLRRKSSIIDLS